VTIDEWFWSRSVDNAQAESSCDETVVLIRRVGATRVEL
jgi:hypothetical protein